MLLTQTAGVYNRSWNSFLTKVFLIDLPVKHPVELARRRTQPISNGVLSPRNTALGFTASVGPQAEL